MAAKSNPVSRQTGVVVQELKDEVLIYDLQINKAYCLNETSAFIYGLCDGNNSVAEISNQLSRKLKQPVTEDLIWFAIDELKQNNLLENSSGIETKFNGLSRREVIRKVGFASMIALPVISSLVAPTAAMAQSGLALRAVCTSSPQCASGNCSSTSSRCCVPGTLGLSGSNFCCADTASCNSACCTGSGTIIDPGACPTIGFPLRVMCP